MRSKQGGGRHCDETLIKLEQGRGPRSGHTSNVAETSLTGARKSFQAKLSGLTVPIGSPWSADSLLMSS